MKQLKGNLFNQECDAICITTNGFVKKDGSCVMGKGCAKQAVGYFPSLPWDLGSLIKNNGNNAYHLLTIDGMALVSFPVKPIWCEYRVKEDVVAHMRGKFKIGDKIPGWASTAMIQIIEKSAAQLVEMADLKGWKKIVIPRPGCGAGELRWDDIKPILEEILDDRFYIITF